MFRAYMLGRGTSLRINKVAIATLTPVIALGTLLAMGGSASAHSRTPNLTPTAKVVVKPATSLQNLQVVTVKVSQMGATPNGIHIAECDPRVATNNQDPNWCDLTDADVMNDDTALNGSATFQFTIHTGAAFLATHKGATCTFGQHGSSCYIVATNDLAPPQGKPTAAGLAPIKFKDTRPTTKTTVKAPKKAKANSKVSFKVTTKVGKIKPTGTVTLKDGKKKIGSAKETASGKVTIKGKIKSGKNKITATYSGDANYQPSTGKATVTGKK
jgi:hypothetical protein